MKDENFIVSDEEQFMNELDDLVFRGFLEFVGPDDDRLQITPKGLAALAEARKVY